MKKHSDEDIDGFSRKCPCCGKTFYPAPYHVYKVNGKLMCSYSCTLKYRRDHPKKSCKNFTSRRVAKEVAKLDLKTGKTLDVYRSMTEAAIETRGNTSGVCNISMCCSGKKKSWMGFGWKLTGIVRPPFEGIIGQKASKTT